MSVNDRSRRMSVNYLGAKVVLDRLSKYFLANVFCYQGRHDRDMRMCSVKVRQRTKLICL